MQDPAAVHCSPLDRRTAVRAGAAPIECGDQLSRPANRTQITSALLQLRELIFSGAFATGERMAELGLVQRLGVSRTPLRLALAELEHEGLLRGLPGGGYVVREFTQGDVRDAIELRGVLEGTAARFAAERGASARELRTLKEINETIHTLVHRADYDSFERYMRLNETFHARLLKLARSPVLERALDGIVSLPFAGPSAFILAEAELAASREILIIAHRHHSGLVEAIERRQSGRAESLAREHARLALTNLEIFLEHREMLERMPGGTLIALPAKEATESGPAREGEAGREPEHESKRESEPV
jgi:GntR family transcriptional regulator of vanillate catabolism